jgi:hypothetical protein
MSEEDDKTEVYSILSEPFSEEEEELIWEKNQERKYLEGERRWEDRNRYLEARRSSTEYQNVPASRLSLDFETPDSGGSSRQSSGNFCEVHQQDCRGTIEGLIKAAQQLLREKITIQNENTSLQTRLNDTVLQLEKQLIRREADQKKIVGLSMKLQKAKPPLLPQAPTSPLTCDVQLVDPSIAAENDFNWPEKHADTMAQLTRESSGAEGNPVAQHLLGLWDPDVQIVAIGFQLPEWVTIRLTNTEDNGYLGKTGYLIHIRVLENITKNLQNLTGSLSVLEAAFKNNESLLQKENELRLGAEKQVEELLGKLREREAQDNAIAEVAQFEKELEIERQNLETELKQAEHNLEDARKDSDYYDPADPTQEKAKTKIEQQVEEMTKIENAIKDLESERERLAQVRNL